MEISALGSTTDAARSVQLTVRQRPWFRRLRNNLEPEMLHQLWWPIDLLSSSALVKLPFRKPQPIESQMAWDAVTGRLGIIDIQMPDVATRRVSAELVLETAAPDATLENDWYEMLRDYLVRKYKPSSLPSLNLEGRKRVYISYEVMKMDGVIYLVDSMLDRADPLADITAGRRLRTEAGLLVQP